MNRRNLKQAVTRPAMRVRIMDLPWICQKKITACQLICVVLAVSSHLPVKHPDQFQMLVPVRRQYLFFPYITCKINLGTNVLKNNLMFQLFLFIQIKIAPFYWNNFNKSRCTYQYQPKKKAKKPLLNTFLFQ